MLRRVCLLYLQNAHAAQGGGVFFRVGSYFNPQQNTSVLFQGSDFSHNLATGALQKLCSHEVL
jgi:hypothetical protein